MSVTFTKLFSSITASTVWAEDSDTRVVWITMLAMADRRGRVWASIPGIAGIARVSVPAARKAIAKFLAPDPDSRTKTDKGRRIEEIDGGWRLINYVKYRELQDDEERREYFRVKKAESREAVKKAPTDQNTQRVMKALQFTDKRVATAIQRAINGQEDKEKAADLMIRSYQDYLETGRRGLLKYTFSPPKFFSQGHWHDDGGWPIDVKELKNQKRL